MGNRRGVSRIAGACPGEDISPRETPRTVISPKLGDSLHRRCGAGHAANAEGACVAAYHPGTGVSGPKGAPYSVAKLAPRRDHKSEGSAAGYTSPAAENRERGLTSASLSPFTYGSLDVRLGNPLTVTVPFEWRLGSWERRSLLPSLRAAARAAALPQKRSPPMRRRCRPFVSSVACGEG